METKKIQRRSRTFRVFVSSTFSDMKEERNALQEHVFPKLKEYCEAEGCHFQAIDLRWGVSTEASLDQQAMNICLKELKRCQEMSPRPNFIVLLGDRYGWQPLPPQIESTEFDLLMDQLEKEEVERLKFDDKEEKVNIPQGEGNGWYRLDKNALYPDVPGSEGEYVLLPREKGSDFEDFENWEAVERNLLTLLRKAADKAFPDDSEERKKYFQSATHQEIEEGALSDKVADSREHVVGWMPEIENDAPTVGNRFVGFDFERTISPVVDVGKCRRQIWLKIDVRHIRQKRFVLSPVIAEDERVVGIRGNDLFDSLQVACTVVVLSGVDRVGHRQNTHRNVGRAGGGRLGHAKNQCVIQSGDRHASAGWQVTSKNLRVQPQIKKRP